MEASIQSNNLFSSLWHYGPFWISMGIICVMICVFFLYTQIRKKNTQPIGGQFRFKIATFFTFFTLIPCLITGIFALSFVNRSLNTWFHTQVKTAIEDSQYVAKGYVEESERSLGYAVSHMSQIIQKQLDFCHFSQTLPQDIQEDIGKYLDICESLHGISSYLFFFDPQENSTSGESSPLFSMPIHKKIIAQSVYGSSLKTEVILEQHILLSKKNKYYLDINHATRKMIVLTPIKLFSVNDGVLALSQKDLLARTKGIYLLISKDIDPDILSKIAHATQASNAYKDSVNKQKTLVINFIAIFIFLSLILIAISMTAAFSIAKQVILPVSALVETSQHLRQGKAVCIDEKKIPATRDLRHLMRTFNDIVKEVADRKKALEEVNESLNQRTLMLEGVLEGVSSGVLSVDISGNITISNQQASLFLFSRGLMNNLSLAETVPEFLDLFHRALANPNVIKNQELIFTRLGHSLTFQVHIKFLPHAQQVIITFDDVTQLIAAQRKNAWTEVAKRVAHEIKNPLTPILLSAERLRRRYMGKITQDSHIFQDCIETIIHHVKLIGALISEFAHFARMPVLKIAPIYLTPLIERITRFHQEAYPQIIFIAHCDPILSSCDIQQIEQVLINLIKNAIESVLEAKTQRDDAYQPLIEIVLTMASNGIQLDILDNGIGLPVGEHALLSQPYLTTKPNGMGLGLTIVQKIIDDHKGLFTIFSENSGRVCARIILPLTPDDVDE